jgi:phage terminase small subunit
MSGLIIKTKYGDAAMNPLVSIARKAAGDVLRFASEFGLTPRARALLQCPNPQPPPGGGKFTGLIAR